MPGLNFRNIAVAATALAGALAFEASAAPSILIQVNDPSGPGAIADSPFGTGSFSYTRNDGSSYDSSTTAGAFGLQARTPPGTGTYTNFITYCFELGESLSRSSMPRTYTAQSLAASLSVSDRTALERLWFLYYSDTASTGSWDNYLSSANDGVSQAERTAAFQLAIWNIVTETADGDATINDTASSSNKFWVPTSSLGSSNDIRVTANLYLQGAYSAGQGQKLVGLYFEGKQDLLMPCSDPRAATIDYCLPGSPDPSGGDVPVPATAVLFGAGLAALAGLRRRRA